MPGSLGYACSCLRPMHRGFANFKSKCHAQRQTKKNAARTCKYPICCRVLIFAFKSLLRQLLYDSPALSCINHSRMLVVPAFGAMQSSAFVIDALDVIRDRTRRDCATSTLLLPSSTTSILRSESTTNMWGFTLILVDTTVTASSRSVHIGRPEILCVHVQDTVDDVWIKNTVLYLNLLVIWSNNLQFGRPGGRVNDDFFK